MTRDELIALRQKLLEAAADACGVPAEDILGPGRYRGAVVARHALMYLFAEYLGLTVKETALFFGGRDHTCAVHARRIVAMALTHPKTEHEARLKTVTERLIEILGTDVREQRGKKIFYTGPSIADRVVLLEQEARELRRMIKELHGEKSAS